MKKFYFLLDKIIPSGFGYTASGGSPGGEAVCNDGATVCSRGAGGATGGDSNTNGTGGSGIIIIRTHR